MKITAIHHAVAPLQSDIRNAFIDFSHMTASIVAVVSNVERNGKKLVGLGFNSNGRYAQRGIIEDRIIPRLLAAAPEELLNERGDNVDPFKCWDLMMTNEKPGGHGDRSVAVGTIDMALWDLAAKIEKKPLYRLFADWFNEGVSNPRVYCYAAGGYYYPEKGLKELKKEIQNYLDLGYKDVKIKIGGSTLKKDISRIESVLDVLDGDGSRLAVDANGRFNLQTALEYGKALESYNLKWFEEAGDPLDYLLQASLSENCSIPIATGENLFSMTDTRNLVRYAGLNPQSDFIQVDPVLSYGVVEYIRILEMLQNYGWSAIRCIPHGGHQLTLHIAAAFGLYGNESYPTIFQPFGGFGDTVPIVDSYIEIPAEVDGIGIEIKNDLIDLYHQLLPLDLG